MLGFTILKLFVRTLENPFAKAKSKRNEGIYTALQILRVKWVCRKIVGRKWRKDLPTAQEGYK